ncbi:MAG: amidohydrolase, partial [Acidaminococcus fermentans]|nr:amidohydrolase [Acidaminococcus fermentans]
MDAQKIIEQAVDGRYRDELVDLSRQIWELAEVGYEEKQSAETLCQALERHGFTVTRNLVNIPTAFKGVWGQGKPVVGILGEYDALPGLSQEAGCP